MTTREQIYSDSSLREQLKRIIQVHDLEAYIDLSGLERIINLLKERSYSSIAGYIRTTVVVKYGGLLSEIQATNLGQEIISWWENPNS